MYISINLVEKIHGRKWLLVDVNGTGGPKGSPKVRLTKAPFTLELLTFYTSWKP